MIARQFRALVKRFDETDPMQVAGSLTFTTLLSLVPLVTVVLAVLSLFPVSKMLLTELQHFITINLMPGPSANAALDQVGQFVRRASHFTAAGLVMLAVTAVSLMLTIDATFNRLWKVPKQRAFLRRVAMYLVAITLGPPLIGASLWLTTWLVSAPLRGMVDHESRRLLAKAVAVAFPVLAFTLLYRIVPNTRVPWLSALGGGLLAGAGFEAMKSGFAWFVTHFGNYGAVYGAFAALPVFLLWIFLSWLVVLVGAVVAATFTPVAGRAGKAERA
jgi:membrane protein